VSSVIDGPLAFGARELRRIFPQAWDGNIQLGERWFRNDLYALFLGNRYLCLEREMQLFDNNRTVTDIDAAIIDIVAGRLALFELKWQEPIGMDEKERKNRARRLRREVSKWVETILIFLRVHGEDALKAQLGVPTAFAKHIRNITLFVLARHHAQFSGFRIGHASTAVASWRQFQRARLDLGSRDDTFLEIFARLKKEECRTVDARTAIASFGIAGFDVEAEQFFVVSEPGLDDRRGSTSS
jgi:hypothetical protein